MATTTETFLPEGSNQPKFQRDAILKGIERGEKAIKEGHIFTHKQAKEKLKRWL